MEKITINGDIFKMKFGDSYIGQPVYTSDDEIGYIIGISNQIKDYRVDIYVNVDIGKIIVCNIDDLSEAIGVY